MGTSLRQRHPGLLAAVQNFWLTEYHARGLHEQASQPVAYETGSAKRFAALLTAQQDELYASLPNDFSVLLRHRDGYRNFAVNLCHVLPISCCQDCEKNLVPKHGLVEFRVFDMAYGDRLHSLIQIAQRLMQRSCD